MRQSHQALRRPTVTYCRQCSRPVLPHRVCPSCGFYHGRVVKPEKKEKES